ncbi:hypothetical protein SAMN05216357_108116 [Porphyromonadaceae bacterium KH3CP3RA]|nr:hypothetical protein SAMN05216357_108116 [Porphyromonadaceae bacterium KH3CP3RA]
MLKSRIDCIIMASYFNLCFIFVKLKPVFSVLRPFSPAIHSFFVCFECWGAKFTLDPRLDNSMANLHFYIAYC